MKTYIARVVFHDVPPDGATPTFKSVYAESAEAAEIALRKRLGDAIIEIVDEKEGNPQNLEPGVPV